MKSFVATFLVLLLSIPTAMAGSVDGKGIYCCWQTASSYTLAFGYWFQDNQATKYSIKGYDIEMDKPGSYFEVGTGKIEIYDPITGTSKTLSRRSLYLDDLPCDLIHSTKGLIQKLQAVIDAGKAENKI